MRRHLPWLLLSATLVAFAGYAATNSTKKASRRMSDDERGELLYDRHCVQCHGETAAGNGPATDALIADVPDLRGKLTKENREANATLVLDGRGAMPGYSLSFDRYDARRVLRWMQKVGPGDAPSEPEPEEEEEEDGGELAPEGDAEG